MKKIYEYEINRDVKIGFFIVMLLWYTGVEIFNLLRIFIPPIYKYFQSLSVQTVFIASCVLIPSIFFLMK